MMEEVLYGCDVMPSAVHITGATLSGAQPNVGYQHSRLYTMPYGRQSDGSVHGSLEHSNHRVLTLFNTSDPALRTAAPARKPPRRSISRYPTAMVTALQRLPTGKAASRDSDYGNSSGA